jgi:hypothetical protein
MLAPRLFWLFSAVSGSLLLSFKKKTQFLTIFTTFCINYYDNVGLMRPLMIGINLVGKDTLNSPHFKTIDDAKNQRYL